MNYNPINVKVGTQFRVVRDFTPEEEDDLGIRVGEVVEYLEGWLVVLFKYRSKKILFLFFYLAMTQILLKLRIKMALVAWSL